MQFTTEKLGDVAVVVIQGEYLYFHNASELVRIINTIILETNRKVVLDMSRLQSMDISAFGPILLCLRMINSPGGDLKLCCMTKDVRDLFEQVHMDRVFEIYNTREEAVRSFGRKTMN